MSMSHFLEAASDSNRRKKRRMNVTTTRDADGEEGEREERREEVRGRREWERGEREEGEREAMEKRHGVKAEYNERESRIPETLWKSWTRYCASVDAHLASLFATLDTSLLGEENILNSWKKRAGERERERVGKKNADAVTPRERAIPFRRENSAFRSLHWIR
jgi:hypothetical protein